MNNRIYKFRAWDKSKKEWLDYGFISLSGEFLQDAEGGGLETHDCKSFDLMQYTGLKDKNDKEIYEGDILQRISPMTNKIDTTVEVYFDNKMAGFYVRGKNIEALNKILGVFLTCAGISKNDYEIIGNIYENKDLLG